MRTRLRTAAPTLSALHPELYRALTGRGIAHTNLRSVGTHEWGHRNDELHSSRPVPTGSRH